MYICKKEGLEDWEIGDRCSFLREEYHNYWETEVIWVLSDDDTEERYIEKEHFYEYFKPEYYLVLEL